MESSCQGANRRIRLQFSASRVRCFVAGRAGGGLRLSPRVCVRMDDTPLALGAFLIPSPGDPQTGVFRIGPGETSVGRNPSNTVHLARGAVSRFHAKIALVDGEFVLIDLDSRNGTFVNERRVRKVRLQNGDAVTFGNRAFVFSLTGPDKAAKTPTALVARDVVRIVGDDTNVLHPSEVMAREAANATQTFLRDLTTAEAIPPEEALLAHRRLSLLYQLSEQLRALKGANEMLAKGLDFLFGALSAERGVALLRPSYGAPLEVRVVKRRKSQEPKDQIPISQTVLDRVMKDRMALMCHDALDDSRFRLSDSIRIHSLRSIICVPLLAFDRVIGAVQLDTSESLDAFTKNDLEFAAAVANELAISIENQRLQQEAARNERMAAIGLTITNVAHNIKNILLMNKGAQELMDMSVERVADERIGRSWRIVRQCLERINGLSADMLNFTRVQPREMKWHDINAIILANRGLFVESLGRAGVRLRFDLQEDLQRWMMNEQGLQRALLNLVVNANDAIERPEKGEIVISASVDDQDCLRIAVADNGCGVPEERIKDIFQLFYTTKSTRGTGLGLPMVQRFVENLGGQVLVQSKVGEGSIFTMIFPRIEQEPNGKR